ncbi:PAS domain-containing protein [Stachybotrys elegans]|uniref:PAS domain-containing protein n=1 Tax=Stachybotrys elegans TaxID=80388 RepID=A0A8K0T1T7_9HYPO|nr:PAS domain-containing protein [Stachybotrys elegans]
MEGYYQPNQLQAQELQRQMSQNRDGQQHPHHHQHPHQHPQLQGSGSARMMHDAINMAHANQAMHDAVDNRQMMTNGDAFNGMMSDGQVDLERRRSMPQAYPDHMNQQPPPRRMSSIEAADMLTFGGGDGNLNSYQFSQPMGPGFPTINTGLDQMGNYVNDPNEYSAISPDMMGNMIPSTFANMSVGNMSGDSATMDLFSPTTATPTGNSMGQFPDMSQSIGNDYSMDMVQDGTPGANLNGGLANMADGNDGIMNMNTHLSPMDAVPNHSQQQGMNLDLNMASFTRPMPGPLSRHVSSPSSMISPHHANSSSSITQQSSGSDATTPATNPPARESKEKTIYSKSGFDMLKALWLVATRKDPQIHLGAVDMSCAFVVCDVTMNDCPIIYVSDNFQNLTGYSRHEIVGQNCRFLQAPDGKVEAGTKREFVDEGAVYNLKKMIREGREVQQSLINYRKGGKPFLNLLTMIPIPWDTDEIRYFIGFQIDLVECPDAISSGQELGAVKVNYKHTDIGQYIWTPPQSNQMEPENGQTLGMDDVSTLLQQFSPKGMVSDWHKQSWDKMLLENTDDVVHVLSLKGLFLYLSPACKRVLEYDAQELVGNSLSSVCHPSDIVPVTRELKDTTGDNQVNIVFRIRRKQSGYTWFESHGSLFIEQGKGRKCIILVGRKRPVFALSRRNLEAQGGIGDSELWTKLSTSGMFLFVSSHIRSLLDLQPESLIGTSIQDLMRKESRAEFGRTIERARRGRTVTCKHEVQNRRGQVLQAQTTLYPGDASEGQKPSFLLAQTKLLKASSRSMISTTIGGSKSLPPSTPVHNPLSNAGMSQSGGTIPPGSQDAALASDDNIFDELRTTKCSSWQFELRQMEKINRILAEELGGLLANKKKRKRRKGVGNIVRDCANCHTRNTPEWRRGPSGQRDLCNSCGLRWAKQTGRVSPRNSSRGGNNGNNGDSLSKKSASPIHSSPLHKELTTEAAGAAAAGAKPVNTGDGAINPAQLTNQNTNAMASSGAPSAIGMKPPGSMPPPSQPMLVSSGGGVGMTSIREERENSQP